MIDLWLLIAAALLVVIAMWLVAAETAVARVSGTWLEELRREGTPGADRLGRVLADRARYITVLLFGHSACSTIAVGLVTLVCVRSIAWPTAASVALAVGIMIIVIFVALGVAPRTLGRQHADRIALGVAGTALALARPLGPLTKFLIALGNALTPGKGYREGPFASAAELRDLVDRAEADQVIESDERRMIHSVFALGDTVVREVMVPRTEMVVIESDRSLQKAMTLALRSGYSRVPVIGDDLDDVLGVVYLKDLTRRLFDDADLPGAPEESLLTLMRPAFMVPDSKQADDLLREMQAARVHMAIIIDEYGGTAGLVTIEDILEEIVGEITDEYDVERPEVEPLPQGGYRVSARLHVESLGDLLNIDLDAEKENVDTVGGLLAKRLGRVPIPGAFVEVDGWMLVAESAAGRRNRIGTVLVTRIERPSAGSDEAAGGLLPQPVGPRVSESNVQGDMEATSAEDRR